MKVQLPSRFRSKLNTRRDQKYLSKNLQNDSKTKVLHVKNGSFGAGGTSFYIAELLENIQEFQQFFWCKKRSKQFKKEIHLLSGDLKTIIDIVRPDIVHCHVGGGDLKSFKLVETLKNRQDYKIICTYHALRQPFMNNTDCNLFVNEYYVTVERYKDCANPAVIPGGVNDNIYKYKNCRSDNRFTVGRISRVVPDKMNRMLTQILDHFSHYEDMRFKFIGGHSSQIKKHLIPLIPDSAESKVTIVKIVKDVRKKIRHLLDLDIFIHFTSPTWHFGFGENFSIALIEAMMLGIPIVTENKGGIKKQVKHGYNGFLCDDVDDYIKYIRLLYENRSLWEEISNNSFKYARENLTSKIMASKYVDLCDGLLE